MLKTKILGVCCALLAATTLSGCPDFHPLSLLVTINNVSENTDIKEIRVKAPGATDFGPNLLSGTLSPEESTFLLLDAPLEFLDEGGVNYQVRIVFEGFLDFDGVDTATLNSTHAGDEFIWNWSPGNEPTRTF